MNDVAFWKWLQNRNKSNKKDKQPRLQLPLPEKIEKPQESPEEVERGVWILDL